MPATKVLAKGQAVEYFDSSLGWTPATVVDVGFDRGDGPEARLEPFYMIRLADGREKGTVSERLRIHPSNEETQTKVDLSEEAPPAKKSALKVPTFDQEEAAAVAIACGASVVVAAPSACAVGLTAIGFSSGGNIVFLSELITNIQVDS